MSTNGIDKLVVKIFAATRLIRDRAPAEGAGGAHRHYSHIQLATLHRVKEMGRPLMRDIAEFLRITPPAATSMVNGLVEAGLLRRLADGRDRRSVKLALTARGERLLAEKFRAASGHLRLVLGKLNAAEQRQLVAILDKLCQTL